MVSFYQKEINKIESQLESQLDDIDDSDIQRRFQIHKFAFDQVMELVKVYQPLLKDIKLEYESLISHVVKAQNYTEKMEEEIKTASNYPTTIANHERYRNDLRKRLHGLRNSNNHRLEKIRDIQIKCDVISKSITKGENEPNTPQIKIRRDQRRLPNMSLSELTDLSTMQNLHNQLENQMHQLQHTQQTKYASKEEEVKLIDQLMKQITKHDQTRIEVKGLIQRKVLLQAALNQAKAFHKHHYLHQNIGEVVVRALVESSKVLENRENNSNEISVEEEIEQFFPDSSTQIGSLKESDYIVLCIKKFEKLFNEEKYKEAADLAVVVPRGVLRNYTTLIRFKNLSTSRHVLYYCQQLVRTVASEKLDGDVSYECIDSALKEGRIDLVNLWISQGRITSTELIADNLTSHADLIPDNKSACLDLAASIYWDLLMNLTNNNEPTGDCSSARPHSSNPQWIAARGKYFDSILECYIKSGRIEEAIDMLTNENSTPISARSREQMYKKEDLFLLIQFYPNIQLIRSLISKNLMTFSAAIKSLLEKGSYGLAAELIVTNLSVIGVSEMTNQLIESIPTGISTDAWEEMLNYVNESDEKIIIEMAASYLVQISLDRSYMKLREFGI